VMIPTKSCQSGGLFWKKKKSVNTHQNLWSQSPEHLCPLPCPQGVKVQYLLPHSRARWPWRRPPPWPRTAGSTWIPRTWRSCSPAVTQTHTHAHIHHVSASRHARPMNEQEQKHLSRAKAADSDSLTCFSSSLFGPKMARRCSACSVERPCGLHRRFSNTSSIGMFSCAGARTASRQGRDQATDKNQQIKAWEDKELVRWSGARKTTKKKAERTGEEKKTQQK
jgi:hypothetical protein